MSTGLVVGGVVVLGILAKIKAKIDELENQNQILNAKNNDLIQENRGLINTVSRKDVEIKKLQTELEELKKSKK